jgi:hypothetical protein
MLKKTLLLLLVYIFFACNQTPKTLADTIDFTQIKSIKYTNKSFPESNIIEKITDITADTTSINGLKNAEEKFGPYKYWHQGRLIFEYKNGETTDFKTNKNGTLFEGKGKTFISKNALLQKYQEKK